MWTRSSWASVKEDWKPNAKILEQFVRVHAWNGNFRLNVGPMTTGDLPEIAYERMQEFGEWTLHNGESVFDVTDAPEGESSNVPVTARPHMPYLHRSADDRIGEARMARFAKASISHIAWRRIGAEAFLGARSPECGFAGREALGAGGCWSESRSRSWL